MDFKKDFSLLKETRLFQEWKEEDMERVLNCLSAQKRQYNKGTIIFQAGDRLSKAALLLEGCVYIQREDYWGNLSILNKIGKGELFGESYSISDNNVALYHTVAVENSVVLFLDLRRILTVCSSHCSFHTLLIQNLFAILAEKNRILAQKLAHLSQRTTREKLLSYLSEQSIQAQSSAFTIPFNRQQLADFLSVDRSAMSYELCKMRDEGMLAFQKNHFVLYQNQDYPVS